MPLAYKPRWYGATITIPADPGPLCPAGKGSEASFNIVNVPFIVRRISHAIVGTNGLGATPIDNAVQDGNYTIRWRTDQRVYDNEPIAANAGYGSESDLVDSPSPVELAPQTSVVIQVTNGIDRAAGLKVQVVFAGVEPISAGG